jgi:AcrR family transcriptional regulator
MAPRHKDSEHQQALSDTRQRLLEAAAQEFAHHGYARANINTISRAAGFAKGTVYNYFPSKRALMRALLNDTAETHLAMMVDAVQNEEDPSQRLVRFFEAGFAFVQQHVAQGRSMIHVIYGPDVEFRLHLHELYQPMFRLVSEDIVAHGIAQGVFYPVDPQATAALLMTIYLGTASQVDQEGRARLDACQVADFALRALRSQSHPADEANSARQESHYAA